MKETVGFFAINDLQMESCSGHGVPGSPHFNPSAVLMAHGGAFHCSEKGHSSGKTGAVLAWFFKFVRKKERQKKNKKISLKSLGNGDRFIYTYSDIESILNIQPSGKMAKAYQIRQIRKFILENNLLIRG